MDGRKIIELQEDSTLGDILHEMQKHIRKGFVFKTCHIHEGTDHAKNYHENMDLKTPVQVLQQFSCRCLTFIVKEETPPVALPANDAFQALMEGKFAICYGLSSYFGFICLMHEWAACMQASIHNAYY